MANLPLLDFTYTFLRNHPAAHQQDSYMEGVVECSATTKEELVKAYEDNVCGTSGCLGGYGALFAGYHQVRGYSLDDNGAPVTYGTDVVVDELGEELWMANAGRIAFGITEEQAAALFAQNNTIDALGEMIEELRKDDDAYLRPYMTTDYSECTCSMCVGADA